MAKGLVREIKHNVEGKSAQELTRIWREFTTEE